MTQFSPWPFMTSISLFNLVLSVVMYFHFFKNGNFYVIVSLIVFLFYLIRWFFDVIEESTFEGNHTEKVKIGIRLGMSLFIVSEIMFFFSFFWAFFHITLAPSVDIACIWPPKGLLPLDPWGLPLLNTVILLSSGITITWSHRAILSGNWVNTSNGLMATIFYGTLFTAIQYYEYTLATFSINDSIFGSLFFMLTGFHGIHVIIGTIFLAACLMRNFNCHFSTTCHTGLECAIWYWHFVDVVWLFLFIVLYIWAGA